MQFRSTFQIPPSAFTLSHKSKIFSFGSCFSSHISSHLQSCKFQVYPSIFGVLFSPKAIENAIERLHGHVLYESFEIFKFKEKYLSWDHHSSYFSASQEGLLGQINQEIQTLNAQLPVVDCTFITLGSAFCYGIKGTDILVANCHKVPSEKFYKHFLSISEIKTSLINSVNLLLDANPKMKIIFTLSPVRHIKDGMVENARSKARLLEAIHATKEVFPQSVDYFPAYELILDDLRDYRFYGADMLHPTQQAIDYVWEKFSEVYFENHTLEKNKLTQKIAKAVAHKPFDPNSISHKKFVYQTLKNIQGLEKEFYPGAFEKEIEILKQAQ